MLFYTIKWIRDFKLDIGKVKISEWKLFFEIEVVDLVFFKVFWCFDVVLVVLVLGNSNVVVMV